MPRLIRVELIVEPSINAAIGVGAAGVNIAMISVTRPYWMDPIIDFLVEDQFQMMKRRLTGFAERLLGTGCQ